MRASKIWNENQSGFIKLLEQHEKSQSLLIHYEQLLKNPETTLQKIHNFLNMRSNENSLNFYKKSHTIELANNVEAWKNLSKPILSNNFNKYKTGLNNNQIEYIEYLCQNLMLYFSYETEHLNKGTDHQQLKKTLIKNEPWLKNSYNNLSEKERNAHLQLVKAIDQCQLNK